MSVKEVDFGKGPRDTARIFARLLDICEERATDILARPQFYLEQAGDEIFRLRDLIQSAQEALMPPITEYIGEEPVKYTTLETIVVVKSDYDRLVECARIIEGFK